MQSDLHTVIQLRKRVARLEQEKLLLLVALKGRRTGPDSQGYHDSDVARWFDPGRPYASLPTGDETVKEYQAKLKPFKDKVAKIVKEAKG